MALILSNIFLQMNLKRLLVKHLRISIKIKKYLSIMCRNHDVIALFWVFIVLVAHSFSTDHSLCTFKLAMPWSLCLIFLFISEYVKYLPADSDDRADATSESTVTHIHVFPGKSLVVYFFS